MQVLGDAGKLRGQVLEVTSGVQIGCAFLSNVVNECASLSRTGFCQPQFGSQLVSGKRLLTGTADEYGERETHK